MPKYAFKELIIVILIVFIAGCASRGYEVKRYTERRERPDFEVTGNAGYLAGSPSSEETNRERKRTRKFYVTEVVAPAPAVEEITPPAEAERKKVTVESESYRATPPSSSRSTPTYPRRDYQEETVARSTSYTEYTVEEKDTLQKISKKFYNSYSKWPRIYEANKDVIKDPNFIKPGITLRIPQE